MESSFYFARLTIKRLNFKKDWKDEQQQIYEQTNSDVVDEDLIYKDNDAVSLLLGFFFIWNEEIGKNKILLISILLF